MTGRLLGLLGGARKTQVDKIDLHLISAAALLQARREAQTLAGGDEAAMGLCVNACILSQAAKKEGERVFPSGQAVLERLPAQTIERWAREYLALCRRENPSCCEDGQQELLDALREEPYERLKWRVLKAFGVLPSEKRAREMTDGDYLYCVMQMMLDAEETLSQMCPACREKAGENRCMVCGEPIPEENASFDEARYEELKRQ